MRNAEEPSGHYQLCFLFNSRFCFCVASALSLFCNNSQPILQKQKMFFYQKRTENCDFPTVRSYWNHFQNGKNTLTVRFLTARGSEHPEFAAATSLRTLFPSILLTVSPSVIAELYCWAEWGPGQLIRAGRSPWHFSDIAELHSLALLQGLYSLHYRKKKAGAVSTTTAGVFSWLSFFLVTTLYDEKIAVFRAKKICT